MTLLRSRPLLTAALLVVAAFAISFAIAPVVGQSSSTSSPSSSASADADVDFVETSSGGHLIIVPRAVLPQAGFVAVHDSTLLSKQDPFGSVIGISRPLPAGTHTNVSIELGPVPGNNKAFTTNATDTIIAMPHKDSNNNGVYDFITSQGADDGPFSGGAHATQTFAGNIVIAAANVTRGSLTVAQSQFTDGTSFKVAWVDLSSPGFVALHDLSLVNDQEPFDSVLAVGSPLATGLHKDVSVPFGKNGAAQTGKLSKSQTVIVMPHKDTNGNGKYDFITSQGADDGPYPGAAQTFAGKIDIATATATLSGNYGASGSMTRPTSPPQDTFGGDGDDDDRGTPGLGLIALLLAVAGAALIARRR